MSKKPKFASLGGLLRKTILRTFRLEIPRDFYSELPFLLELGTLQAKVALVAVLHVPLRYILVDQPGLKSLLRVSAEQKKEIVLVCGCMLTSLAELNLLLG